MSNIQDNCSLQTQEKGRKKKSHLTPPSLTQPAYRGNSQIPKLSMQLGGSTIPTPPNRIIAGFQNTQMLSTSNIPAGKVSFKLTRKETNQREPLPLHFNIPVTYLRHNTNSRKNSRNLQPVSDRTQLLCESGGWVRGGFQGDGDLLLLRP